MYVLGPDVAIKVWEMLFTEKCSYLKDELLGPVVVAPQRATIWFPAKRPSTTAERRAPHRGTSPARRQVRG